MRGGGGGGLQLGAAGACPGEMCWQRPHWHAAAAVPYPLPGSLDGARSRPLTRRPRLGGGRARSHAGWGQPPPSREQVIGTAPPRRGGGRRANASPPVVSRRPRSPLPQGVRRQRSTSAPGSRFHGVPPPPARRLLVFPRYAAPTHGAAPPLGDAPSSCPSSTQPRRQDPLSAAASSAAALRTAAPAAGDTTPPRGGRDPARRQRLAPCWSRVFPVAMSAPAAAPDSAVALLLVPPTKKRAATGSPPSLHPSPPLTSRRPTWWSAYPSTS